MSTPTLADRLRAEAARHSPSENETLIDLLLEAADMADESSEPPEPHTLRWETRFNNGNGGASIYIGDRSVFVTGSQARALAKALTGETTALTPAAPCGGVLDCDNPAKVEARIRESMHALRATFGGAPDAERNVAATAARLLRELSHWLPGDGWRSP